MKLCPFHLFLLIPPFLLHLPSPSLSSSGSTPPGMSPPLGPLACLLHPPQTPPGEGSARILGASIQALVRIGRPSSENPSQHSTGARTPLLRVGGGGTLSCGGGGHLGP